MAVPTQREPIFRISLRELLVLIAFGAIALVSLRYASPLWQTLVATISATAFMAAMIVSLVGRRARQAFAIGFATTVVVYVALLAGTGLSSRDVNPEFNPATGQLPTTRLLSPLYAAVAESRWIDYRTGQEVSNYDPHQPGAAAQYVSLDERPERGIFMQIGHCWWALVLGYLGGWFARGVYLRREGEPQR
jgi:hypothetical protein